MKRIYRTTLVKYLEKKIAIEVPFIVLTIILLLFVGYIMGKEAQKSLINKTYYTCMDSYLYISGEKEEQCGRLQDKTDTFFECTESGVCWLEHLV